MTVDHDTLNEGDAHEIGYRQSSDPGAVGAGISWIDTSGGTGAWVHKVRNATNTGWETVGSGGGGSTPDGSFWCPDAAPDTPSSYDDEFDDESLDTKWSEFDIPTGLAYTEGEMGLYWTNHSTSNYIQGLYQEPAASNGWSIMAKISVLYKQHDDAKCGLMLLEDTSNLSTSDIIFFVLGVGGSGTGIQVEKFNAYNSYLGNVASLWDDKWLTTMYLRIRADSSNNWYFDWSSDGIGWLNKDDWFANGSNATRLWAPTGFGLCIRGNTTAPKFLIHWFRYSTNTDVDDVVLGNRINYFFTS